MRFVLVLDGQYWIGLNDIAVEGTFVWPGGSGTSYTAWKSVEPSNGSTEYCVRLLRREWWDTDCHIQHYYICEFNTNT